MKYYGNNACIKLLSCISSFSYTGNIKIIINYGIVDGQ